MKPTSDPIQRKARFRSAFLGLALAILPLQATAQGTVSVSAEAIDALTATCTSSEACQIAIEALVAELSAANPDVSIGEIIGAVAGSLSAAYNAGIVAGSIAQITLQSLAAVAEANGLSQLASSIRVAVESVAAGNPINVEAVAEGSASPT
jgi:uncharacterized membrane protein (Fun14 family)